MRSTDRILTSHVGSLPRLPDLLEPGADAAEVDDRLRGATAEVVRRQVDAGIDLVNDGEYGKPVAGETDLAAWAQYIYGRLGGFEMVEIDETAFLLETAEGKAFPGFYAGPEASTLGTEGTSYAMGRPVAPITYDRLDLVQRDIDNLLAAVPAERRDGAFLTSLSAGMEFGPTGPYYASSEAQAYAVADAMRVEYRAIVDAGLMLQLDDPHLVDTYFFDYAGATSTAEYRRWAAQHVEVVNHALAGIPPERVRLHVCWGSWKGPHVTDLPLREIVDLMLQINAGIYSIEAANPRHEHEWKVWRDVALPEGKVLMPGVVTHKTNVLEHPEVVADRILRYCEVVGRENVIAGTDCGMGNRIHPEIAWAKLGVLAEGARLASDQLWP